MIMNTITKTVGLFIGKFAPLHLGHQLVIETALKEMDQVIVVIYDSPQVTSIPLNVRAKWIRSLYPKTVVIEGWDGPPDVGNTPEICEKQEKYILGILGGTKITHFYSSEFYGDHMSRALGAKNRIVDDTRKHFQISATEIRNDAYTNRNYVSPVVYKDLIINIVFLGAPSTGKTTIAQQLAKIFNTSWMPEYGREYWDRHQVNRRLSVDQLLEIAEGHIEHEDTLLLQSNKLLFTDTNAITTLMFSLSYHGNAHDKLRHLASIAEKRYDLFFLCDTDIPYDDTWDRSGDTDRITFQKQIIADLKIRRIPYFTLKGNLEKRIHSVKSILSRFQKYDNILEHTSSGGVA